MADEQTLDGPKVTIGFERSVQVRDYETAKASIYIQVPTEPGDDLDAVIANVKPTFFAAKANVFEQLGISFDISAENVIVEKLEKALGAVEVVAREATAVAAGSTAAPRSKGGNFGGKGTPAPSDKAGLWAELAENPTRYFDNRQTKTGKQPDFKRKYSGEGLWLDSKDAPSADSLPGPEAF